MSFFWNRDYPDYNDHPPAHFHVRYGDQKAIVAIETLTHLQGRVSPRVFGLVIEWAVQHQNELLENWQRARRQEMLL